MRPTLAAVMPVLALVASLRCGLSPNSGQFCNAAEARAAFPSLVLAPSEAGDCVEEPGAASEPAAVEGAEAGAALPPQAAISSAASASTSGVVVRRRRRCEAARRADIR